MILPLSLAFTLSAAGAVSLTSMESLLERPIEQRVRAFKAEGHKGYVFLSKTAADSKEALQTRWRAITTMGRLDPVHFRGDLDKALRSPEWFIRNAALIALLSDDRERAVSASARLLSDPALIVRTQAVRNLIALDAREEETELWKALYDRRNFKGRESLWIRAHIAEALAKFAGPGRAKAFERMLLDEDTRLHKWAVQGLEQSTGMRLSGRGEAIEIRRQKWLSRLGVQEI